MKRNDSNEKMECVRRKYPSRLFTGWIVCIPVCLAISITTSHAQGKKTGIEGVITWYGGIPRIPQDPPRPYVGAMLVKTAPAAKVVTTVQSDSNGHFFVALPPGHYYITQTGTRLYPRIEWITEPTHGKPPWHVIKKGITVHANAITKVKLIADSGIR